MKIYVHHDEHGYRLLFREPGTEGNEGLRRLATLDTTTSGLTEDSVGDVLRTMARLWNAAHEID